MSRSEKRKKKKKRMRKFITLVLLFFAIIIFFSVYFIIDTYQAINKSYNDLDREKSDLRDETISLEEKDPFSILLLGIEDYSSGGVNGRTDVIIVATFNPKDERLKLLSIPRDTLVEIDGKDSLGKINSAHVYGGVKSVINTVENFLDIPIDYFASVDFDGFVNIIDILGGVEVNVPFNFSQDSLEGKIYYFYEGPMELNGDEALAFVRMRKQDPAGDIGRNQRQQEVIKGIVDKLTSFSTITKISSLANEIGNNVETNFKISDAVTLFQQFSNFSAGNIDQIVLETYPDTYNRASVEIPDSESLQEVQNILKTHLNLYEETEN